jgi:hypothetical protein
METLRDAWGVLKEDSFYKLSDTIPTIMKTSCRIQSWIQRSLSIGAPVVLQAASTETAWISITLRREITRI